MTGFHMMATLTFNELIKDGFQGFASEIVASYGRPATFINQSVFYILMKINI